MKAKKRRKVVIFIIIFFILLSICSVYSIYKLINRSGKELHPKTEIPPQNVTYYCQYDENWADDNLGSSRFKMSDSGCLVSCIASALKMQGQGGKTPGELNKLFSDNSCYDSEGNMQWEQAEETLGVKVTKQNAAQISANSLDEFLKSGIYPIARVNLPYGVGHFVLITGSKNGEYLCMDPLSEKSQPTELSYFGDRIFFVRYIK